MPKEVTIKVNDDQATVILDGLSHLIMEASELSNNPEYKAHASNRLVNIKTLWDVVAKARDNSRNNH